jgi:retron-type reverse transcriptase
MIKGFSPMWCEWIHTVMSKGSIIVEDNDVVGRYFQTCKGVRQGDPLSPILFNLAVDVLVKLIDRAKVNGQIKGIVPHLVDDGLSILQYMDDTIVLLDHDLEQARNFKIMLNAFEQLSGFKINFHRSEMFC